MEIAALVILLICSMLGFAALFFTTFGTMIILIGSILYALLTKFAIIDVRTLIILAALYGFGELLEYVLIISGAKKFGASNAAVVGAFLGGVLGAMLGAPILGVGLIFGAFIGMFLGAFSVELSIRRDLGQALKVGIGGLLGRIGSIAVKVVIALVMFYLMAVRIASF